MQQRRFHDFSQFLDLFFAASHITVRYIGLILDLHHSNSGINFWGKRDVNLILVSVDSEIKEKPRENWKIRRN